MPRRLLYADNFDFMTIKGNEIRKMKEAFDSKGLKAILGKPKVMVNGSNTMDGFSKGKVSPCGVCSLGVKANSGLCAQFGKWNRNKCNWEEGDHKIIRKFFLQET